jgi:gentisate 1,2-dioxygenase
MDTTMRPTTPWLGSMDSIFRFPIKTTLDSLKLAQNTSPTMQRQNTRAANGCGVIRDCAHFPGFRPVSSPIGAYRWEFTNRALTEQLLLEDEGHPATVEQGHAAVRYVNPTTGGDILPTIRAEFHRMRAGAVTPERRKVGSSVFQVFDGTGSVVLGGIEHNLDIGDLFVVPSWIAWSLQAETTLDLFRFSDAPIIERLGFGRLQIEGKLMGGCTSQNNQHIQTFKRADPLPICLLFRLHRQSKDELRPTGGSSVAVTFLSFNPLVTPVRHLDRAMGA